jgi:hypothetical protein
MSPSKTQPALLGGIALGVLSALPVINLANCCCAWILFGGGLAAYLLQQNYPDRISIGDGAIVGLMAGAIGAIIAALLSIPLYAFLGPLQAGIFERAMERAGDMPPEARAWMESMRGGAFMGAAFFVGTLFKLCLYSLFGMVGGLLGTLFFAKDGPPPPPPQDPTFTPPTYTPPPPPPPLPGDRT